MFGCWKVDYCVVVIVFVSCCVVFRCVFSVGSVWVVNV